MRGSRTRRWSAGVVGALVVLALAGGCGLVDPFASRSPESPATPTAASTPDPLTEDLQFHPVRNEAAGDCPEDAELAVDDPASGNCLTLAPSRMAVHQLADVDTQRRQSNWGVVITLSDEDAEAFTELTGQLATLPPPQNRLAVVIGELPDGTLLTAPMIQQKIPGPGVQISGDWTQKEAEDLARRLGGHP